MATIHGKDTYVSVNSVDLSSFTSASTMDRGADSHDVTTYGSTAHKYASGLKIHKATLSGVCDTVTGGGPGPTFRPLLGGLAVVFIRRLQGTGSGKPEENMNVIVTSYKESNPVADMVTWTAELQVTGDITTTLQP